MVSERRGLEVVTEAPATVSELRTAVAARDELIAVMGHELRNAMAPLLLLAAQFEMMPSADDMMRAKVAMLTRNLNKFVGTLDRVSEVAQLREGKLALEYEQLDAEEVVHEVARELAELAKVGGAELRLTTTPVTGRWDRTRLKQIANHLIGNAIRYASGTVDISLRADGAQLELVVQDQGPGIPAGERAHLFDRFERKRDRRAMGLGVGLWVVKAITRAMGGSVHLADSVCGARFVVSLPRG